MKLKLVILIVAAAVTGGSVTVLVIDSNSRKQHPAPPTELPAALSNYNQTFKLNTNPPLWPEPLKNGGTNGRSGR